MKGKIIGVVHLAVALGACVGGPCYAQSKPVVLITSDEAKRPRQTAADLSFRAGISRGPAINLLTPPAAPAAVRSPVHLQIKFAAHGGAQIDQASIKLTDVVVPAVDLTDRIKTYAGAGGIDVPEAEIPPGVYTIRADVKDTDGHPGSLTFTLNVAQP